MKFFISGIAKDKILVMARAESEDGQTIGDLFADIRPGEEFAGLGFAQLVALGLGEHTKYDRIRRTKKCRFTKG